MHLSRPPRIIAFLAVLSFVLGSSAFAQLERAVEAHGGLASWKTFGSVEFDQTWTSTKGVKKDHQLFDLHTRDGLIASDQYTLGASHGEVWIKPDRPGEYQLTVRDRPQRRSAGERRKASENLRRDGAAQGDGATRVRQRL